MRPEGVARPQRKTKLASLRGIHQARGELASCHRHCTPATSGVHSGVLAGEYRVPD